MLRLTVLGGLGLTADGAPYVGPAVQRRRLLLLAVLAAAGRRGMSRDKVLSFLWPDADAEQGRQALYQALHVVRRAFGQTAIAGGTTSLTVTADVISSDVADFTEAIGGRAYEQGIAAYGGPFLDGLTFDGAPELERWVTAERARLAREYVTALEQMAAGAVGRRDMAGAVRWRRRLAAEDPLSTAAAIGLIEALVAIGDRGGALQAALVHESLVRAELETEADESVRSWVARLKAGRAEPAVPPTRGIVAPVAVPGAAAERARERLARAVAGRYVVERRLAAGHVEATYAATDARDRSPVELHVIHPHVAAHVDADHFMRTVARAVALDDGRLLRLLDCSASDELVFYVSAPAGGTTLRDRLAQDGPFAVGDAVGVGRAVALALAMLHAHELTHGDLRPKYVHLMAPDAVVSGYAVTQALFGPAIDGPATDTAVTIGAPAYMSPEQLIDGARPNPRSDVYSFGCLVYEMLTGEPPFGAGGGTAAAARKLTMPPPSPRQLRDSVPEALDGIIRRCLARVPADRFASAVELPDALSRIETTV
ncbi:MAG TPA: protein kinase [Gemmatimonadaceae bacterium]|nr:protein kinase [Gemmatimonadaceae bacterium]